MKKYIALVMMLLFSAYLGGCGDKSSTQQFEITADTIISQKETDKMPSEASPDENDKMPSEASQEKNTTKNEAVKLADGIYTAEFITDSSMFRVNETCDGKGTLTVANGEMTIHISLGSKNILKLYRGLAEDAAKEDDDKLILPTEDTVTYNDGMTEEVNGFDVPVPALETEFDLALIGKKGTWYDHKVSVSNPVLSEEPALDSNDQSFEDGIYSVKISFEGGTGKAQILSPVTVTIADQKATATVQWNSPNYDYMLVDGEKYLPINTEGNSVFEIPVLCFDQPMSIVGDTVAMSKPHEVEYTITFHSDTMEKE
ncbi:MAG: iron transporter [Lachnospiraceae bacterium]|nr:iron transporter [Lachnospiraceae bacterium]